MTTTAFESTRHRVNDLLDQHHALVEAANAATDVGDTAKARELLREADVTFAQVQGGLALMRMSNEDAEARLADG